VSVFQQKSRSVDTFGLVAEKRVIRHADGRIEWTGGGPGSWSGVARERLAEFYEAGLVEEDPEYAGLVRFEDGSNLLRLTKAGKFLLRRWLHGPAEMIVEMPVNERDLPVPQEIRDHLTEVYSRRRVADPEDGADPALDFRVYGGHIEDPDWVPGHGTGPYDDRVLIAFRMSTGPRVVESKAFDLTPAHARALATAILAAAW
jgi:hypothetical protein